MSDQLTKIFSEMTQFVKTMGMNHNDFARILQCDIENFLAQTKTLQGQMQWQGYCTLALTSLGAAFAVAGSLIPKTKDAMPPASSELTSILDRLKDNNFLRETCKTAAKFFPGIQTVVDVHFRSKQTQIEATRTLLEKIHMHNSQSEKSAADQSIQQTRSAMTRLLEAKARGG